MNGWCAAAGAHSHRCLRARGLRRSRCRRLGATHGGLEKFDEHTPFRPSPLDLRGRRHRGHGDVGHAVHCHGRPDALGTPAERRRTTARARASHTSIRSPVGSPTNARRSPSRSSRIIAAGHHVHRRGKRAMDTVRTRHPHRRTDAPWQRERRVHRRHLRHARRSRPASRAVLDERRCHAARCGGSSPRLVAYGPGFATRTLQQRLRRIFGTLRGKMYQDIGPRCVQPRPLERGRAIYRPQLQSHEEISSRHEVVAPLSLGGDFGFFGSMALRISQTT